MAAAIGVRSDYTSADLRHFVRRCRDADQVRRVLALAVILDGGSRSEAAQMAGVTLQIVRDWVLRFNEGGPEGLATRKAPGKASILNDEQRARLAEQVEAGPIPAAHGVVRWRLVDLGQWIWDEFGLSVTRFTLGREQLKPCFTVFCSPVCGLVKDTCIEFPPVQAVEVVSDCLLGRKYRGQIGAFSVACGRDTRFGNERKDTGPG